MLDAFGTTSLEFISAELQRLSETARNAGEAVSEQATLTPPSPPSQA